MYWSRAGHMPCAGPVTIGEGDEFSIFLDFFSIFKGHLTQGNQGIILTDFHFTIWERHRVFFPWVSSICWWQMISIMKKYTFCSLPATGSPQMDMLDFPMFCVHAFILHLAFFFVFRRSMPQDEAVQSYSWCLCFQFSLQERAAAPPLRIPTFWPRVRSQMYSLWVCVCLALTPCLTSLPPPPLSGSNAVTVTGLCCRTGKIVQQPKDAYLKYGMNTWNNPSLNLKTPSLNLGGCWRFYIWRGVIVWRESQTHQVNVFPNTIFALNLSNFPHFF